MDNQDREAKERKKKAMAIAFLPLSVAFFVWRLQADTSAAPPPRPPEPIVKKVAPEIQKYAGPVKDLQRKRVMVASAGFRDPFTPAFSLKEDTASKPQPEANDASQPVVTEIPAPRITMPSLPPLRPFEPLKPFEPKPGPAFELPRPAQPAVNPDAAQRPEMPWTLTGIVKGDPDVAILRHWDGSRRIARAGDDLDRAYRLSLIEEDFVALRSGGKTMTLRLGADTPQPKAPGATSAAQ